VHVKEFILNITSDQPDELRRFYQDVVCLPLSNELGENALKIGGGLLAFDNHSEVHGPAREPQRHLLNLLVDDLAAEQARLEAQGVTFIRKAGREEWGGLISTFLDPDGNYCQLVQYTGTE
jgi:predicted enzyme related to lactoylglutathione lyase